MKRLLGTTLALGLSASAGTAAALPTTIEGAAGGGIVPWALLAADRPTASLTWVDSGDYNLMVLAVNGTVAGRVELSYARMSFDINANGVRGTVYGAGHTSSTIDVDVLGAKLKLLDMSDRFPALALGVQHKRSDIASGLRGAIGSGDDSGTDVYLAATKIFPVGGRKLLLNGTLRYTKANQAGILGFGGQGAGNDDGYGLRFEGSAGVFASKSVVFGAEYRAKPDNLKSFEEDDWWDVFLAWMPDKHWSVVAAYAGLGDIVKEAGTNGEGADQRGLYLQLQVTF